MNKIVLIGAGSTQFGLGTIGDIFKSKILEGSTIVLHDINPEALDNTKKISEKYKEELGVKCNILHNNYIDYLSLFKVSGKWRIISKVFHMNPGI